MALRAVGKRPGVGGAGEIDGFDAHGIAVANKDVAGDATRNGGRVLQQHVLMHVRESAGVGGFDAVARAQTALFEGHGAMGAFLLHEGAVERAQFVDVGLVPAFECHVDLARVGAGTEEAHRVGTVESQGVDREVVTLGALAGRAVAKLQLVNHISRGIVRLGGISPVVSCALIPAEVIICDVYRICFIRERGCAGRSEGDLAVTFIFHVREGDLRNSSRGVSDVESRRVDRSTRSSNFQGVRSDRDLREYMLDRIAIVFDFVPRADANLWSISPIIVSFGIMCYVA